MNFNFEVFAKSVPAICIVSGVALIIVATVSHLGGGLVGLGVFLLISGIGLQVLYLYLKYRE